MLEITFFYAVLLLGGVGMRLVWPKLREDFIEPTATLSVLTTTSTYDMPAVDSTIWEERCQKLEILLNEKNRMIANLERQLTNEHLRWEGVEKIRDILDQRIVELKEQNRTLRMEADTKNQMSLR